MFLSPLYSRALFCNCSHTSHNSYFSYIRGGPEGSILGPFLFNIYLNDILFFLKHANLGNYADDSTLYAYNKNLEIVICNPRGEFSMLSNWFCDNYMVLNQEVCHFMLFGVKENEHIWPDLQWYYTKTQQPKNIYV